MRFRFFIITLLFPLVCFGQVVQNVSQSNDRVVITLPNGILSIIPVSTKAVRIQFSNGKIKEEHELILTSSLPIPKFKLTETTTNLDIITDGIKVSLDKKTGSLSFLDKSGNTFLKEKVGSRRLTPDSIQGEPCFVAEQSFESPADEYIFGLGQFQDGHYNLKNIARQLTQVNTQIAIPFIYSSKGYGLLWHQYGLTDFNPTDNTILLQKQDQLTNGNNHEVEVTTVSGTQKVSQGQSFYTGKFNVTADGNYSIFLDLGGMGNRHYVAIDGKPCIDQTNLWLPPTVSSVANLKAGEHTVHVLCKSDNHPNISWKKLDDYTTFRSPNAKSLDYVVFSGKDADEVIANYRNLSGNVPMLPLWAYGFWQCRERYTSGTHLVETVKEFRKRNIPIDVIVQDWQYWGKYGWGVMKFDETNYPNPTGFIKELHDLNAHFNISVWENLNKESEIGKTYSAKNLYIPESQWVDMLNPAARQKHWDALNENLFVHGVDSWWMDATEPENDALKGKKTFLGLGDFYRLTYPLFVSKAVYEGQRKTSLNKRVCILTRSAFAGQQRYGIINWSGDINGTWDSYKRQIVAGLNFTLTGMPYWTTDIGGFFRPGQTQYTDEKYHDLLTRWFQWGTLSPILRIHGYQTETEPWKYGPKVEKNMRKMLDLRYRLMPYIYSEAWQTSKNGSTFMRPLVMDFKDDTTALNKPYEYMLGKALLVTPITEPDVSEWNVYLPKSTKWVDFWTGKRFDGGQTIKTAAPLNKIPLFVKAGSIIPMGKFMQYTGQKSADTLEIRIYKGANAKFELYEDEGDNYNYEKGNYTIIPFEWNELRQTLIIGNKIGNFEGCLKDRIFNIVLVNESEGLSTTISTLKKKVKYKGKEIKIK
jgi:alpha-D-xyloside xylohydrolase